MESAAQSIASKFGQLLVDELREVRGVGDKVVHLMDELATMNAVLRMLSEADQSSVDHLVREWEKQVRELACDAEDCAAIYWLRINRPIPLQSFIVKWPKYQFDKLLLQRTLAADVKALLDRTTAVSERRARYGIDHAALPRSACFTPVSAASASAHALRRGDDPDQFVGIREQANALAERIKAVSENDKKLKVFSIVGFGGLGKTTLAVELCRQLDAEFPHQALVSVSQAFDVEKDVRGLLVRVLHQIKERLTEEDQMNMEQLASMVKERLMVKRYLIVIDDVWSVPAWEAIRIRLPENNCGSRIIVTTRIETVAKATSVSADLVHHMKPLETEASEKLFVKRVFGSIEEGTYPIELKDAMDKILKKCGGMPLAIVSIAGLLASYNSAERVEMWTRVFNSIGSQMESHPTLEGMRQVIALSYDYLPHHLKACMMYLSIFPEDYVIAKDRLLHRWIAEGLVAEKRGLTLLEVAEDYYNELISRNMILPEKSMNFHWETVEGCRVHDTMLEVMVSKSLEANFVSLVGPQYRGMPYDKVRRLSVHDEQKPKKKVEQCRSKHGIEAMKLQHVRSLTTFKSEGLTKLLSQLGEFKLLRVLDLEDCEALQNKHMRDVCRLYLLRFLSLRCTNVIVMPSQVGDLEHLETLDVQRTRIDDLPRTLTKLNKLECLKFNRWTLPRGLENMKALREMDGDGEILSSNDQVAREISELQQLQVLSLIITRSPQDKKHEEEFFHVLASSLSKTYSLRSLSLGGGMPLDFLLHISSLSPLLRCLKINGPISKFPDWISSLTHLTDFAVFLAELAGDQLFDVLCKLPNLQSLTLESGSCKDRDPELVARIAHNFPELRIMY